MLLILQQTLLGIVMIDARTVKVLVSLLVAMTGGALLLMSMDSAPPQTATAASIIGKVEYKQLGLSHTWRRIVVHSAADASDSLPQRCHFIISADADASGKGVVVTDLWKRQVRGYHVMIPGHDFDSDSIGICLIGDFSSKGPVNGQFNALVTLVGKLQTDCRIAADCVYIHSQLDTSSDQPGKAFPSEKFNAYLLKNLD